MNPLAQRPRTLILPPAPYAAALLGGWYLDRFVAPIPLDLGNATPLLGWLCISIGLTLLFWAAGTLWRHHTTVNPYHGASQLCTTGPFRYSRNPIYLGDWCLLVGMALLLQTAWPLVFAPLIWVMLRFGVIRHEEAHLEAKFGAAYRAYQAKVRRWF